MYLDIIEKTKFYKERVLKSFLQHGIYPDNDMLSEILDRIDTRTAYLNVTPALKGDYFNSEEHNAMINSIYLDLKLLYDLLHRLTVLEFTRIQSFADSHLKDLENKAEYYLKRAEQETNASSLGKTIFFKDGSFHLKYYHDTAVVDLGKIKVRKGSNITAKIAGNGLVGEDVFFTLTKGEDVDRFCPYNYNQDIFKVPGTMSKKTHDFTVDSNIKTEGVLMIDSIVNPNRENEYIILGAKDKILVKQFGEVTKTSIRHRPTGLNEAGFDEKSYIDFYVVGAESISFKFNKKPIATNFSLDHYEVTNLNYIHHFFIECDENFAFSFETKGEVFATKQKGIVDNNKLSCYNSLDIKEFKIVEYEMTDTEEYELGIQIKNADDSIDIKSVIVKENVNTGGESYDSV